MIEHYFDCPHCWQNHLKMIDPSIAKQQFIEVCETCCNPLEFSVTVNDNFIEFFMATSIEQ